MGLVTGLKGTGDKVKAAREMIVNFMKRLGHNRDVAEVATGGVAMVTVKVEIPPFAKAGMKLDAIVSILNDADSLFGGVLEITRLTGVRLGGELLEGEASGRVYVGGYSVGNGQATYTRNHPTVGNVLGGCKLLSPPKTFYLSDAGHLELRFLHPSVSSVTSAVDGINRLIGKDGCEALIVDEYLLRIKLPENMQTNEQAVRILNRIRGIPVETNSIAKVVIDETSGIILAGQNVHISPCAISVSDITVSIVSDEEVSQPLPGINGGTTEIVNRTRLEVNTQQSVPQVLEGGATVEDLVKNLAALNLSPLQLIAVFQKLDESHYLHAELEYR